MAEMKSMTTAEVVAKTLIDEHADFLGDAVAMVAAQLMEAEVSAEIGAARGEVSHERTTHRNGYRPRSWETRVGEIDLLVSRKRSGEAYFPSFLEPRRPAERAIVSVVMEAYVNGVSTRKVDRLVEQLGISSMSKDRVSGLCRELDERVEAFRNRPLEGEFPYLWLDAKHLKVRSGGHVRSKALVVAYGVHESGCREVIGIDLGEVECKAFWVEFLRGLRSRGLGGVRLCVVRISTSARHELPLELGEERGGEALELARAELDLVSDLQAGDGILGDVLDDVVPAEHAAVVDQRVAEQLDLVERVAVLARRHPQPVHERPVQDEDHVVEEERFELRDGVAAGSARSLSELAVGRALLLDAGLRCAYLVWRVVLPAEHLSLPRLDRQVGSGL